jgi:hypothetical protein
MGCQNGKILFFSLHTGQFEPSCIDLSQIHEEDDVSRYSIRQLVSVTVPISSGVVVLIESPSESMEESSFSRVWVVSGGYRFPMRISVWDGIKRIKVATALALKDCIRQNRPPHLILSPHTHIILVVVDSSLYVWDCLTSSLIYSNRANHSSSYLKDKLNLSSFFPDVGTTGTFVSDDRVVIFGRQMEMIQLRMVFEAKSTSNIAPSLVETDTCHLNCDRSSVISMLRCEMNSKCLCEQENRICHRSEWKPYAGFRPCASGYVAVATNDCKIYIFSNDVEHRPLGEFLMKTKKKVAHREIIFFKQFGAYLISVMANGKVFAVCVHCFSIYLLPCSVSDSDSIVHVSISEIRSVFGNSAFFFI